jgi:TPR repeat/PEGA domain
MHRPSSGVLRMPAVRGVLAASWVVLCILLSGTDVGLNCFAQSGERDRDRVKARPRVTARKRVRRPPQVRPRSVEVSLWVISNPPGCRVFVDDLMRGETNSAGELEVRLTPGSYSVRVSRDGYITRQGDVEVSYGMDEQEVEFTLPVAMTTLNVVTDPPETEIYLDNIYRGTSNAAGLLVIERVSPGQPHTLRATKEAYQQQSMPLSSYSGQISIKLVPDSIRLKVVTEPPETEVYLDGVYKGTSTADGLLLIEQVNPNQTHTLRAKREGYTQQSVNVPHNSTEVPVKLSPDPVVLLAKSLKQHAAQGRLSEAFEEYNRLAAAAPDHQELPRLLESMLQSLQARTATILRRVGPYGLVAEPKELEEMADLYEQARRWREGDETIDEFARYWGLKHLLARAEQSSSVAEREGLQQKARAALAEIGGHGSRNVYLLLDLGWAWWKLKDKPAAQKNFKQVQELKPDWAYTHFALGSLAMNEAESEVKKSVKAVKYAQAINSFTSAIELKHDFARAYALRSIAFGAIKRYEEAVASGLQAVTLDPQSAYAHFALGFAYFQKGKSSYRHAINEYNQALLLGGAELDDATKAVIQQKLAIIRRVIKK